MKTKLSFFCLSPLLLTIVCLSTAAHIAARSSNSQPLKPLATERFNLNEDMEVGLEINARSTGASWAREGAEAAALLISVDGVYNQDLLLWAGDESFQYRVMLGRLTKGKHRVSVALNLPRSAAGAHLAEVKSLRPLLLAPTNRAGNAEEELLALAHSPVLYARANTIDHFTDIPLVMYYEILRVSPDRLESGLVRPAGTTATPAGLPGRGPRQVSFLNGRQKKAGAQGPSLNGRRNKAVTQVSSLNGRHKRRNKLGSGGTDLIVRYTAIFTNEDGGTQTLALMARWGRGTDIEWVYEFRLRDGKIIEETYQGVNHETKAFTGSRTGGRHPLLAVASDNNNFSDLACSAVRFAPLPIRVDLETATRESVMDRYPQTYRVMTEELQREQRISPTPTGINIIADPRDYFYIEASSQQKGAALGFDVKVAGQPEVFPSDLGDARLRIERSGNFRTAVRLPHGVSPSAVETITARCHTSSQPAAERGCNHLRLMRALVLDQSFVPRTLPLQTQPAASLAPGETRIFRLSKN
jgi:hypothetical protein